MVILWIINSKPNKKLTPFSNNFNFIIISHNFLLIRQMSKLSNSINSSFPLNNLITLQNNKFIKKGIKISQNQGILTHPNIIRWPNQMMFIIFPIPQIIDRPNNCDGLTKVHFILYLEINMPNLFKIYSIHWILIKIRFSRSWSGIAISKELLVIKIVIIFNRRINETIFKQLLIIRRVCKISCSYGNASILLILHYNK